jgi:hypothetical protein
MDNKRLYAPPRFCTRYAFDAQAEIITSDAEWPSSVTNISFGGCRLLTTAHLPAGATVTIKIRTPTDSFTATAIVIHSTANDVGVMFDKITPESLSVLMTWINAARSAAAAS